jgi:hypothetical protein
LRNISRIGSLGAYTKKKLKKALDQEYRNLMTDFNKRLGEYQQEMYINPVLDVVSILPKDELAAIAEPFVNLTSLKRRVSTAAETVAGPIDVALVSKGDGFVWIKRKHYFDAALNPHFAGNYFGSSNSVTRKGNY